ncbi:hypothetical protein NL676_008527 [Syzygium grande]|nr:hypothetical protein NL676_008527 [Syzygium grande]
MPKAALATSHLRSLRPSRPCFEVAELPLPRIKVMEAKNDLATEVIHRHQFKFKAVAKWRPRCEVVDDHGDLALVGSSNVAMELGERSKGDFVESERDELARD